MGQRISGDSSGGAAEGHLALPPTGSGPGVVLLQEWWGLVPHIVDLAERLATAGFVVFAPDLYHGETTTEPDEAGKRLMALDLPKAGDDIAAAAGLLLARHDVTSGAVGVIGFCMGGGLALWSTTISDQVSVAVPFYPAMPWEGLDPQWEAAAGKHVQMHLAESDGGSESAQVAAAAAALRDAGAATVELHDYAGSQHAFVNDTRPEVHDADHTRVAWGRAVDFLRTHLV